MGNEDVSRKDVLSWVQKAENDLKNAEHTLLLKDECPTDTVCYDAQQCAEKYLKALLAYSGVDFPKTHSIAELVAILPGNAEITVSALQQETLTDYANSSRYPGDYEVISLGEAKSAVSACRKIRRQARKHLKSILSRAQQIGAGRWLPIPCK